MTNKSIVGAFLLSFLLAATHHASAQVQTAAPVRPRVVEVTWVKPGWPADIAGLEAGDIVLEVNGVPVRTIDDIRRALQLARFASIKIINVRTGGVEMRRLTPWRGRLASGGTLFRYCCLACLGSELRIWSVIDQSVRPSPL